ncbi:hypothetical protein ACTI_52850 [Actinoplanes sp. OR16]|uniref:hypothetical protein n=1 Tax=Actinoplanes sp. OR16 TaxID=946334 RepID=UPI000F6B4197|nr:hypothetical protein [Actinoplanes sp. OR16]BBH68600.1 hypothetical protein ACTI_52850 [Actinoplanes sp. OR16]
MMRARLVWAVTTAMTAAGMVAGCGGDSDGGSVGALAPVTVATVDPSAAAAAVAEAEKAAGLPPMPDEEAVDGYLAALEKINPEIVSATDPDQLVDRGRNQCVTIKDYGDDEEKVVKWANTRFSSPDHPDGFGVVTAEKINEVVEEYLCPKVGG